MSHSPLMAGRCRGPAPRCSPGPLGLRHVGNRRPASLAAPVGNGAPIGGTSAPNAARDGISTAVTSVGTVMTSGGFTLYRYTKDRATPPTSTCTGPCAASWPPIAADGQPALDGVDAKLIGTLVRPDGSKQLTVAGWPVYRYIKDMVPGIVNGQGVGGVWLAVGPDGKPIAGAKPAAPPARPPAQARRHRPRPRPPPEGGGADEGAGRPAEGRADQGTGGRTDHRPRRPRHVEHRLTQLSSGLRAREGWTLIGSPGIFGYSGG